VLTYLQHFLRLRQLDPQTEMAIVTPYRPSAQWWPLLHKHFDLRLLQYDRKWRNPDQSGNKFLFTCSDAVNPSLRVDKGPPPHDVCIWFSRIRKVVADPVTVANANGQVYSEPGVHTLKRKFQLGQLFTVRAVTRCVPLSTLVDSGAQVNIISSDIVRKLKLPVEDADVSVGWLNSDSTPVAHAVRNVEVSIHGHPFIVDYALVIPLARFDLITGIGWLEKAQATQQYYLNKHISLLDKLGRRVQIKPTAAIPTRKPVISVCQLYQAKRMLKSGATAFLCHMTAVDGVLKGLDLLKNIVSADCSNPAAALALLEEFSDIFKEKATLPDLNDFAVKFELKDGCSPVSSQPYKITPAEFAALKQFVQRLLDNGWVTPAEGEWSSPVMLLSKPDGTFRMVVDYRRVNSVLKTDSWPLPRSDVLTSHIAKHRIFSKFDLTEGYYQLRIADETAACTTFTTPFGAYQWRVLPMGIHNAPSAFSRGKIR